MLWRLTSSKFLTCDISSRSCRFTKLSRFSLGPSGPCEHSRLGTTLYFGDGGATQVIIERSAQPSGMVRE